MVESFEHLVLEHLVRFQAVADRMEAQLNEMVERATNLEALIVETSARLEKSRAAKVMLNFTIDQINGSLDRIERRLDLTS